MRAMIEKTDTEMGGIWENLLRPTRLPMRKRRSNVAHTAWRYMGESASPYKLPTGKGEAVIRTPRHFAFGLRQ